MHHLAVIVFLLAMLLPAGPGLAGRGAESHQRATAVSRLCLVCS